MYNIFVYGSLMFPEIVKTMTGNNFERSEAVLKDHKKYRINDPDRDFKGPAMIREEGGQTKGVVLLDVDQSSKNIIEKCEHEYELDKVLVETNKQEIEALAYIGSNFNKDYLYGSWSKDYFEENYLDLYVEKIVPEFVQKIKKDNII